ncbi:MAG: iron ABC transporter permease [Phycisphaerales bacterium]|nr:MAG: iron ABC transporter permease [Phycisphaerales bacterium]
MIRLDPRRYALWLGGCVVVLFVLVVISPGVGTASASFGWWDVWRAQLGMEIRADELAGRPLVDIDEDGSVSEVELAGFVESARLIFAQRFPRTLLAMQVGITLALCGVAFQILFRNPLATPYTLGIASGGSLGALIAIRLGLVAAIWGLSSLALAAFAGAIVVVAAVFMLARGSRRLTSNELLLAGVTMGLFCSAMMMLVTVVSDQRQTFAMVRWMMGSLDAITTIEGAMLLPLMLPAWVVLMISARALNQYRLGDELATARGVSVARLQGMCVLVCTLAVAAVVAQCGPIGFVGLVVPHSAALLFGSDCRILLPASALIGGTFLILCDWVSQLAMRFGGWATGQQLGSATLPIGVVTALVGVPIFLVLLKARWK